MSSNKRELDKERLATTDEHGHRVYLYPEDVEGKWKDRRAIMYWSLIIVYLVLPWFYIDGKPALMVNIFKREFTFFGSTLHGIEPILFFLILISGLFFIAFITSLLGRVWCGWACPQTVFIHSIFSKIERIIEGGARTRRALDRAPWSLTKIAKKTLKWLLFLLISLHIAHTFIGYFVGPRELLAMSLLGPSENFGVFLAVMIFSSIILFDFGWFREQFCIIACPYGRMQSVMMDNNSLVIAYDSKRGDPRRGQVPKDQEGDCINCYACVKVCPTGIDIRRGTQLECIACTNCIDACDEIMRKIKKPEGLIKYSSENVLSGGEYRTITPRSILYLITCLTFVLSFFFFLNQSKKFSFVFIRGSDSPYTLSVDSKGNKVITNHFIVKLSHQSEKSYELFFRIKDPNFKNKIEIITPFRPLKVNEAEIKTVMFFKFDPSILNKGSKSIKMEGYDSNGVVTTQEVVLVGPAN